MRKKVREKVRTQGHNALCPIARTAYERIIDVRKWFVVIFAVIVWSPGAVHALERPDMEFKVFQFPKNMMPRIDADTSDWDIVPDDYSIGTDQLLYTTYGMKTNPKDKDITVR